jgi:hypothetical protein
MKLKTIFVLFISGLFIVSLCDGCKRETKLSPKGSMQDAYKYILKEREIKAKSKKEPCNEKFLACLDKCKEDSSCEEECYKNLSSCKEKLPKESKTIKK